MSYCFFRLRIKKKKCCALVTRFQLKATGCTAASDCNTFKGECKVKIHSGLCRLEINLVMGQI